jgi:hypothetical protein
MTTKRNTQDWKVGDLVKVRYLEFPKARIVELRGPLGPGGAQVYRVCYQRKPKPRYVEVLADQLVALTPAEVKPRKPKSDA